MAFLVFEGLDGSGKSTLIRELTIELSSYNIPYLVTREPGGSKLGNEIRAILLRQGSEPPTPRAEILLYEAIRNQHVELTIKPFLQTGGWVLCDRFTASSLAFQGGGRQLNDSDIQWLNTFATDGLLPDLNIFLDLPVEEIQKRCQQRHQEDGIQPDRFEVENTAFHKKVHKSYLQQIVKQPDKWLVLDAEQTPSDMRQKLMLHLEKWLLPYKKRMV